MTHKVSTRRGLWTALALLTFAACLPSARGVVLTETFTFNNLNQLVPDGSMTGLANQQSLTSSIQSITSVSVALQVSGGYNGDLYAYVSHGSAYSVLLDRPGRTATNSAGYYDQGFNVTFSDAATNGDIHTYRNTSVPAFGSPLTGTWQPDARTANPSTVTDASARTNFLSVFNGAAGLGNWTLFIADVNSASAASSQSTLTGWGLTLTGQGYGSLAFDANTATAGAQDGTGVWDTTTANWYDGSKNVVWSNTFYDTAVFGSASGTAGTVTVGNVNANAITFNAATTGNYLLTGGTITLGAYAGGPTPTITANADATVASVIAGTSGMTKAGGGVLTLSGANTYTGATTVNAGTLLVNGSTSNASPVAVNNSGTLLGGTGTVGSSVTINPGARVTAATSSTTGTLTLGGGLTLAGTNGNLATYLVDIGGSASDKLVVTGNVDLSTVYDQLSFNTLSTLTGSSYQLLTYTGSLTGTFDSLANLPNGYTLQYNAGEIDLVAVPEPATVFAGLLLVGAAGYFLARGRKRLASGTAAGSR